MHQGDILDPRTCPNGLRFTHLLHAAADSTIGPSLKPIKQFSQIVDGTRNVLDFAVKNHITRVLLTSSGGAYGPQPSNMAKIDETYNGMPDPLFPNSAYGVAKRTAEHLCALYSDDFGIETVIARCFAFVGPDLALNAHFAIGNFIRDALQGKPIIIKGDGSPLRSYMDQRDLSRWLTELLLRGNPGHAYNVGSDQAISISELAHRVRDLLAPKLSINILDNSRDPHGRNRYIPNIDKAKTQLGLRLEYSVEDGILSTAEVAKRKMQVGQP
jgi:dTDP-glucose 4,6-dehydratase